MWAILSINSKISKETIRFDDISNLNSPIAAFFLVTNPKFSADEVGGFGSAWGFSKPPVKSFTHQDGCEISATRSAERGFNRALSKRNQRLLGECGEIKQWVLSGGG